MHYTLKEQKILADFNRGKLTAKQAQKQIARLALIKTRKANKRNLWK